MTKISFPNVSHIVQGVSCISYIKFNFIILIKTFRCLDLRSYLDKGADVSHICVRAIQRAVIYGICGLSEIRSRH